MLLVGTPESMSYLRSPNSLCPVHERDKRQHHGTVDIEAVPNQNQSSQRTNYARARARTDNESKWKINSNR